MDASTVKKTETLTEKAREKIGDTKLQESRGELKKKQNKKEHNTTYTEQKTRKDGEV